MEKLIKGEPIANLIKSDIRQQILNIWNRYHVIPYLKVIMVGNNEASLSYVKVKQKQGDAIGIKVDIEYLDADINIILMYIHQFNNDPSVHGIIVQLPLPNHLDTRTILDAINPLKDVDGLSSINMGLFYSGQNCFIPCTAQGVITLIKHYLPLLTGKNVLVIGRSLIVGKPLAELLLRENATVTIAHSKSKNLAYLASNYEILISAVGQSNLITHEWVQQQALVIDVGISRIDGKLVGDVVVDNILLEKVWKITPVPGGVGPMTVTYLLYNTMLACQNFIK